MTSAKNNKSKGKKSGKAPSSGAGSSDASSSTGDERRAARNVARLRDKLSTALDDPLMREQIVQAMRRMIREDDTQE